MTFFLYGVVIVSTACMLYQQEVVTDIAVSDRGYYELHSGSDTRMVLHFYAQDNRLKRDTL